MQSLWTPQGKEGNSGSCRGHLMLPLSSLENSLAGLGG